MREFITTPHSETGMPLAEVKCYPYEIKEDRDFLEPILKDPKRAEFRENVLLYYGLAGDFGVFDKLKSYVTAAEPGCGEKPVFPAVYRSKVTSLTAIGILLNRYRHSANGEPQRMAIRTYFLDIVKNHGWRGGLQWKSPFHDPDDPNDLRVEMLSAAFEAMGLSADPELGKRLALFAQKHGGELPAKYTQHPKDTMSEQQLESLVQAARRAKSVNDRLQKLSLKAYYEKFHGTLP